MSEKETEILSLLNNLFTKEKGFNMLVSEYSKQLYWQIRELAKNHEDTNDILQNVFIKVWRYIDNFKGESKLSSWLYRIARNESITFLNKKNKQKITELNDDTKSNLFNSLKAEEDISKNTIYNKLMQSLEVLPKRQKLVFNLRYFKEQKYKDIAKQLNVSEGALKASYHLAVKKIETFLKEN